jgi:hypothetical protein
MPRATIAAVSFRFVAALVLLSPVRVVARPPEGVSGETVFVDKVRDGLREYCKEKDPKKRLAWLQTLGATGDVRVALALVDAANNMKGDDRDCEAADLLWWYYVSPDAASRRGLVIHDIAKPPFGKGFRLWSAAGCSGP